MKRLTQYAPGTSGNPRGRPPGVPDRRRQLRDALAAELPAVFETLLKAAKEGDTQAASLILSRCFPPLRPTRELIAVNGLPQAATASQTARALVQAAADGRAPADVAAELVGALAAAVRIAEFEDLEARVRALEEGGAAP